MSDAWAGIRDLFWASPPELPTGLRLERQEPVVVSRPGPGGAAVFDILQLTTPNVAIERT